MIKKDFTYTIVYTLFFLIGYVVMPVYGQMPGSDNLCNAVPIMGQGGRFEPVVILGTNFGTSSDTLFNTHCVSGRNSTYYAFRIPEGAESITLNIVPTGNEILETAIFTMAGCPSPNLTPIVERCGQFPGEALNLSFDNLCPFTGVEVAIMVGGDEGIFELSLSPNKAVIITNTDSLFCSGDTMILNAISEGLIQYSWSTGDVDSFTYVTQTSMVTIEAIDTAGCAFFDSIFVYSDSNCVFPGDVDRNGIVDAKDILPIGLSYGNIGYLRPGSSLIFSGQPVFDWDESFSATSIYNGINFKHADCNGDGFIDSLDIAAIRVNYGKTYPIRSGSGGSNDPPLFLSLVKDTFMAGDTVEGYFIMGDGFHPIDSLYGFSFDFNYSQPYIDSNTITVDFSVSWLDIDTTRKISFVKNLGAQQKVDLAYSRTNHKGVTGYGYVAKVSFVLIDNLGGAKTTLAKTLQFQFSDVIAVNNKGALIPLNIRSDSIVIIDRCDSSTRLWTSRITINSARLNWSPVEGAHHYLLRGRRIGTSNWTYLTVLSGSNPFKDVYGLYNNFTYEWQVKTVCDSAGSFTSQWSMTDTFTTGCYPPDTLWTDPVTSNAARLNWSPVTGAAGYEIQGKKQGNQGYKTLLTSSSQQFKDIYGLSPATSYQWRIRAWCTANGTIKSSFTPWNQFITNVARIMDDSNGKIALYPNPARGDLLFINLPAGEGEIEVIIRNVQGGIVYQTTPEAGNLKLQIDISRIDPGLYTTTIRGSYTNAVMKFLRFK